MRKFLSTILIVLSWSILADEQNFTGGVGLNEPFNLQVQMCRLGDGIDQKDYDQMIQDYFDWSVKHEVEVTFVRQVALFTHANAANPNPYDFVEFLATDHTTAGRGWDKWLSTPDGQKLNERWGELAHCDVKMANAIMLWADLEEMNTDNERAVVWNWCDRKPGITWDQLNLKHQDMLQMGSESRSNIGWAMLFPHFGGAHAPAEFAHLVIYPNVETAMKDTSAFANGGWRNQEEYLNSYASCQGRSVNSETIMRRPGD